MRFPESGFTMCGFSAIEAFLAPHARYVPSYRLTSRCFGGANASKSREGWLFSLTNVRCRSGGAQKYVQMVCFVDFFACILLTCAKAFWYRERERVLYSPIRSNCMQKYVI